MQRLEIAVTCEQCPPAVRVPATATVVERRHDEAARRYWWLMQRNPDFKGTGQFSSKRDQRELLDIKGLFLKLIESDRSQRVYTRIMAEDHGEPLYEYHRSLAVRRGTLRVLRSQFPARLATSRFVRYCAPEHPRWWVAVDRLFSSDSRRRTSVATNHVALPV